MVRKIDEAKVVLSADARGLIAGLDSAQRRFSKFTKFAFGAMLGVSGVAGLGRAFKQITQDADNLSNAATKIGLTTTELQELRFAGEEVGVALNTTDMAMQRFVRRVGEAANGGGELKGVLDQYNVAVVDAEGNTRNTTDVLDDLADAIAGAGSEQEQLRIAFKAFDSEGAALVSMLRQGSAGLDEFKRKAHDLGLVIEENTVQELAHFNRELEIMQGRIDATLTTLAGSLSAHLTDVGMNFGFMDPKSVQQAERLVALRQKQLDTYQKMLDTPGRKSNSAEADELYDRIQNLQKAQRILDNFKQSSKEALTSDSRGVGEGEFLDIIESLNAHNMAMEDRVRLLGMSAAEQARFNAGQEIMKKLDEQGKKLTEDQVSALGEKLNLLQATAQQHEDIVQATENAAQAASKAQRASDEWTMALNQGLADAIFNAKSLDDVMDALLKRLLNSALFGQNGTGGLLGGITSTLGGSLGGIFGFAGGGSINPGVPVLVGERGPELFIPNSGGTIKSNANSKNMMGGTTVHNENHFHNNVTLSHTIKAYIDNAVAAATPHMVGATMTALQRGF